MLNSSEIINSLPDPMFISHMDTGEYVTINEAFVKMFGFNKDEVIGNTSLPNGLGLWPDPQMRESWVIQLKETQEAIKTEVTIRKKSGENMVGILSSRIVHSETVAYIIGSLHDVSKIKTIESNLQEKVHKLSHFDSVTGLQNRSFVYNAISEEITAAGPGKQNFAVLCLGIDGFTNINDSLGHEVGDEVLRAVATIIARCIRENDVLSRIGGDEFMVLLKRTGVEGSTQVIRKINQSLLEHPVTVQGHDIAIRCSTGIGVFPTNGKDAATLIKNSDVAMVKAKKSRRGGYQYFTSDMIHQVHNRFVTENELHTALQKGELLVHYQPQVDLASGRIIGAEALVRWRHPRKGMVPPLDFIQIAEETSLISEIGEFVMRQACHDLRDWLDAGLPPMRVAVNVSMRQLGTHQLLLPIIKTILKETEIPPDSLELELTESVMLEDHASMLSFMQKAKKLGVTFSIDDFGTGYSNLKYLNMLPIDKLKIDQSFIHDITTRQDAKVIMQAILGMATALGLKVVAEGVETQAQRDMLHKSGCSTVQGRLFSMPVPADELADLIRVNLGQVSSQKRLTRKQNV